MIAAALGIAVLLITVAIAVWTTWYLRREHAALPPELEERRRAIRTGLDELAASIPTSPALLDDQFPVHDRTAAVVAKLLGDSPRGALAEAELVLADCGAEPRAHVLLARAALAANELEAAEQQIARARDLDDDSPMLRFLEARTITLRHLREVNTGNVGDTKLHDSPLPGMITPVELLLLSLEKQRRQGDTSSGVWAPGKGSISEQEIADMVAAHFAIYYRALELLISAVRDVPGFADALYHIARMSLKVGFAMRGRALFEKIEPLMETSPDRRGYKRDLAQLRGDETEVLSPLPKLTGTAQRSPKLRVLD